jgi:hypothetical protein
MLQAFGKIINDLESSNSFMALINYSIPEDKSGEPQNDSLDDDFFFSHHPHDF